MELKNNIILITGGSSGIGLELARNFISRGNQVIICGRSLEKLSKAKADLPQVIIFQCDVSIAAERTRLFDWISQNHPSCNMLINNAAIVSKTNFRSDASMLEKTELEIQTNLIAPISLCKLFLPLLEKNENSVIVNITTGLIYAPRAIYPIYNATKAGLHSFTQVFRHQLKGVPLKIVEVMMPAVDTPWHNGKPPKIAIPVEKAVAEMVIKMETGQQEIKVGGVKILYALSRLAPSFAFKKINSVEG
ncbi:MAG TPA: SDR family NAD(P)-dependent oxidoreductase [Cytophagales bacterium]|nr:SDR family NAD(P)-dependent oxidoreductase [Cytophagales bacterium]